jgi:DNA primase
MPLQNSDKKHDIVTVLEHYGFEIPVRHGWITVRCAFHGDRVKSARLNIDNGGFRCFGCEMAGDVYSIIMKKEGVAFREAIKIAERITGLSESEVRGKPKRSDAVPESERYHRTDGEYVPPRLRKRA